MKNSFYEYAAQCRVHKQYIIPPWQVKRAYTRAHDRESTAAAGVPTYVRPAVRITYTSSTWSSFISFDGESRSRKATAENSSVISGFSPSSGLTFSEQRVFGHFSTGLGRFHHLEQHTVPETRVVTVSRLLQKYTTETVLVVISLFILCTQKKKKKRRHDTVLQWNRCGWFNDDSADTSCYII